MLACRSTAKGDAARRSTEDVAPDAALIVEQLDLASLASLRWFAERIRAEHEELDLGHFALTGLLIDRLEGRDDSRVVTLSSGAHRFGRIAWATEPGVEGGTFVGPDGFAEQRGHTKPVKPNSAARDEQVAHRLWEVSEGMTGVRFEPAGAVL